LHGVRFFVGEGGDSEGGFALGDNVHTPIDALLAASFDFDNLFELLWACERIAFQRQLYPHLFRLVEIIVYVG